jgi:very-short-patch-repair endonuclease
MDFTLPFRGSAAVASGLLTPGVLRGPRFTRLFPDVYVGAAVEVDLTLRARAAYLLVDGRGVIGGYEVAVVNGIAATAPVRTAYDLARDPPLTDAVVAVDALSHRHKFVPDAVLHLGCRHLGARGSAQLPEVVRLANALAESPMESRTRMIIVLDGLPVPVLQHPVGPYLLDLAYPEIRLAIEYDGGAHRTQERAMRDLDRQAYLSAAGWTVLRFTAAQIMRRPRWVAARVREELAKAARR